MYQSTYASTSSAKGTMKSSSRQCIDAILFVIWSLFSLLRSWVKISWAYPVVRDSRNNFGATQKGTVATSLIFTISDQDFVNCKCMSFAKSTNRI